MEWWKNEENLASDTPDCDEGTSTCEVCVLAHRVCLTVLKLAVGQRSIAPAIISYWLKRISSRYGFIDALAASEKMMMMLEAIPDDDAEIAVHFFDVYLN